MLTQTEMFVVFMLDETISQGHQKLMDGKVSPKSSDEDMDRTFKVPQ